MIRMWNHGSDNVLVSAPVHPEAADCHVLDWNRRPSGEFDRSHTALATASSVLMRRTIKYGYRNCGTQLGKLPCLCDHTG